MTRNCIQFRRKDRTIRLDRVLPQSTVLDWLRLEERSIGTKEGCAEGDCGACAVVVVRERDGRLVYEPVNSCITLLGQLDGAELITVEDLADEGELHPVQAAMARDHGSQCGFCTPGIVMSLFAHYHECNGATTRDTINDALAGNLCRCTGYRPIVDAALEACAGADDRFTRGRCRHMRCRRSPRSTTRPISSSATSALSSPHRRASSRLRNSMRDIPTPRIVAGATDVGLWITKKLTPIEKIIHVGRVAELSASRRRPTAMRIGATVSLARAASVLGSIDPDIAEVLRRFGSIQVRACGTVGGNIANGSPIGDLAPMLIALGASVGAAPGRSGSHTSAGEASSSTTASRTASPASSCAGCSCRSCRRARIFAPTRSASASTRIFPRCSRRFA